MPLSSAVSIHPIEAKTGLARARLPEAFLVSLYRALAPYRGCAHGCIYCDGRAEKYYVEGDFARDISVRENLPEIIARDVSAGVGAREFGAICIGSGVTDVYQGVEAELGLTRKTLEILSETGLPLVILTKSDLIQRDFDVISRFPKAVVIFTATTINAADAARLEPGASPPRTGLPPSPARARRVFPPESWRCPCVPAYRTPTNRSIPFWTRPSPPERSSPIRAASPFVPAARKTASSSYWTEATRPCARSTKNSTGKTARPACPSLRSPAGFIPASTPRCAAAAFPR
ncbi:hypothetical protein K7J14_03700 [Treponema zuelzerae]|uniref:Radical SAM protein n=1 Tax=Teretinema zuelzerae TaxID=156 RepID=A0AAE3JI37_9SPIR|nr:hypothetical protein [Teretinema zuelzerae]MCD1653803.1 hypothetical protein [Teretinema zuelzerae]